MSGNDKAIVDIEDYTYKLTGVKGKVDIISDVVISKDECKTFYRIGIKANFIPVLGGGDNL